MSFYIKKIQSRLLDNNKNWLCVICGEPGSGKSYSAMSIGSKIYADFSIDNVIFTPKEFLEKLNTKKYVKKGAIFVFDEAGVGLNARQWYSVQNKLLGTVLQVFRSMNIGVIFTVPNLSYIDVAARKLFHTYIETLYIDKYNDQVVAKIFELQHNSRLEKTYWKYPTFTDENRKVHKFGTFMIDKPKEKLIEAYETRKNEYVQNNIIQAISEIDGETEKPKERVHKHDWRGRLRSNDWYCRICKEVTKSNPFTKVVGEAQ